MCPDNNEEEQESSNLTGVRSKVKDKSGIKALRRKLRKAYVSVQKTQSQLHLQKSRSAHIVAAWRSRLEDAQKAIQRQRVQHDEEMKSVLSKLLFFEGQLRKEQKQILEILHMKDEAIEDQRQIINQLQLENRELKYELAASKTVKLMQPEGNSEKSMTEKWTFNSLPGGSNKRPSVERRCKTRRCKSDLGLNLLEKLDEVSDTDEDNMNGFTQNENVHAGIHANKSYSDESVHDSTDTLHQLTTPDGSRLNLQEKYDEILEDVARHFIDTPQSTGSLQIQQDVFAEVIEELEREYGSVRLDELRDTVGDLYSQSGPSKTVTAYFTKLENPSEVIK